VAAWGRPAREATRPRTAVAWRGRPRRDLRRGKAEASTGPATGEGGGAVQDNDKQLRGVQDDGVQGSHARRQRKFNP
jgi:hypothetical protein